MNAIRSGRTLALFACSCALLAGCRGRAAAPVAPTPARPPAPAGPPVEVSRRLHVDEVGRIPILMYHAVGGPTNGSQRYDRRGLNVSPATFRKQLQRMYAAGWRPVNMREALSSNINVPAGRTPVVITFDDARGSQLHYLADGTLDPNCAVGILEAFHREHADWPLKATFYVMGESRWNPEPFWQEKSVTRKLQFLVHEGFEVANHTTSHRNLAHMDGRTLQWELAECFRYVSARAPGATMDTFALPYGIAPRSHALWRRIMDGSDGGTKYHNRCILLAAGGPSYAPVDRRYDRFRIPRIGSEPGNIETWVKRLRPGSTYRPYVSDGDLATVSVPESEVKLVNPLRLGGARLITYDDGRSAKLAAGKAKHAAAAHKVS